MVVSEMAQVGADGAWDYEWGGDEARERLRENEGAL